MTPHKTVGENCKLSDGLNQRYSVIELVKNNRRTNYQLIRVIEDFQNLRKL